MIDTSDIDITLDNLKRIGFSVNKPCFAMKELTHGLTLYYNNQKFYIEAWSEGDYISPKHDVSFDNTIEIENFIKRFMQ